MTGLRLSLLILGVIVLAVIFLWDRSRRARKRSDIDWNLPNSADQMGDESFVTDDGFSEALPDESIVAVSRNDELDLERIEPMVGRRDETEGDESLSEKTGASPATVDKAPTRAAEETVLVLTVMAGEGSLFDGKTLFSVAQASGLHFGEHDIFHLYPSAEAEQGTAVFSMANILEPGGFDAVNKKAIETPGMVLFMRLPGPWEGEAALERMITTANRLADQLGGELCDGRRQPITEKQLAELRAEAAGYKSEGLGVKSEAEA